MSTARSFTLRSRRRASLVEYCPDNNNSHGMKLDLSWKDGGSTYPKTTSRVGYEYQATEIPPAGSAEETTSDYYCDKIWNPEEAEKTGANKFVADEVSHSKKEQVLEALHKRGYSVTGMKDVLKELHPIDGSDWTEEEKRKFHLEIFRLRKDMKALSKSMGKSLKSCMAYYLGTYKKSDHYRLLKTVCVEERHEKSAAEAAQGLDACAICGDGGELLICDLCNGEYHLGCLYPALMSVPEGNWECDECVNRRLLEARDSILRRTRLYERVEAEKNTKKRKIDGLAIQPSEDSKELRLRPRSPVLEIVKALATRISDTLSDNVHENSL